MPLRVIARFSRRCSSNHRRFYCGYLCLVCAAIVVPLGQASAATSTWIGTSSDWNVQQNWSPASTPSDIAEINNGGTAILNNPTLGFWGSANVTYLGRNTGTSGNLSITSGGRLISKLVVGDLGSGTATISGSPSRCNCGEIDIANSSTGTLNILGGGVADLVNTVNIGLTSSANGTLKIDGSQINGSPSKLNLFNGEIFVGIGGTGNLFVQNGGLLSGGDGTIGSNPNSHGFATIDAATWDPTDLSVGGSGNGTLTIQNGGIVTSSTSVIGVTNTSGGGATVTGSTSSWTASSLSVGQAGVGTLNINSGGTLTTEGGSSIGELADSIGIATLDGSSKWTNESLLYIGKSGDGTLTIQGSSLVENTNNSSVYIGYNSSSQGNVSVEGTGAKLKYTDSLVVGYAGKGTLSLSGGGVVENVANSEVRIGYQNTADGTVNVKAGSSWNNTATLYVGYSGIGKLNVTGGTSQNVNAEIGYNGTGDGQVKVEGAGSLWKTTGSLYIGDSGKGKLIATGGGTAQTAGGEIGNSNGSNGTVQVDASSTWTNNGTLYVGDSSSAIGTINVGGAGAKWTGTGTVYLGYSGNGTINVTSGGAVDMSTSFSNTYVGYSSGSTTSSTGAINVGNKDSSFKTGGDLILGYSGKGSMMITGGGLVQDANAYISRSSGPPGANNTVTVDGRDANLVPSKWINTGDLNVGYSGAATLNVTGGALVQDNFGYVGVSSGSGGTVKVEGSTWTNTHELNVGYFTTGSLDILAGGTVHNTYAYLGEFSGAKGFASVGAGSSWTSTGNLYVGYAGTGTLTVSDGGAVTSVDGIIGQSATSVNNDVEVTGTSLGDTASSWINSATLTVGYSGTGVLHIEEGGYVKSTTAFLGFVGAASNGTVTVLGNESEWENTQGIVVGQQGKGTLNILDSAAVSNTTATIGANIGSEGTVNVFKGIGADISTWGNSGALTVGNSGKGTLTIENSNVSNTLGIVGANSGSVGKVTIFGTAKWENSLGLIVGQHGTGTLEISAGADVRSVGANSTTYIGQLSDSTGAASTVKVDGKTSKLETLTLTVGDFGNGKLEITGGGSAGAVTMVIGKNVDTFSNGLVTVDGQVDSVSSQLTAINRLTIADKGTATLQVKNHAAVNNGLDAVIGAQANSSGTVLVDNATWTSGGDLYVGKAGAASLTIQNGGHVTSQNGYVRFVEDPGAPTPPTATVEVAGTNSQWEVKGGLFIGVGAVARSEVKVRDGGKITSTGTVLIGPDGKLLGNGTLEGNVQDNGTVAPGLSPGTLHIDGSYTQGTTGKLQIELASASVYDLLAVSGQATLGGTLEIFLLNGFTPAPTDTFNFLTASSFSGAFNSVVVNGAPGGSGSFNVAVSPSGVTLSGFQTTTGLPGDFNTDGKVDAADYVVWRKGLGSAGQYSTWRSNFGATLPGDFDFNGTVDDRDYVVWRKGLGTKYTPDDYATWRANFGRSPGSGSGTATSMRAVPEPNAGLLGLIAVTSVALQFSRRRASHAT